MLSKFCLKCVSSVLSNLFYLLITFVGMLILQKIVLTQAVPLTSQIYLVLAACILSCALISDMILATDTKFTQFNFVVVFLMSVSIVFIFVSHAVLPLPFTTAIIVLAIFVICKSFGTYIHLGLTVPAFLCTKVMIVGDNNQIEVLRQFIEQSRGRFNLIKVIDVNLIGKSCESQKERCDKINDDRFHLEAKRAGVDLIITSFSDRRGHMPLQQMLKCRMLGIRIVEAQTFYEFISRKLYIENLKPSDLIFSTGFALSIRRRIIKRAFDIFAASFGLLLFLPFFPVVALLILIDSPGPIFFRQVRMGANNKLFHVIKFRSMRADAEKVSGAVWAKKEDPRVTRIGSFLRKSRIDEIPQLINVLQGEMSLIGPRPERPEFIGELKKTIPFYDERHNVKPGVTGWAQVRYPYGASVEDALEKLRYDLYYIKKQSILLDMEIVFRTVLIVFTRNGAR